MATPRTVQAQARQETTAIQAVDYVPSLAVSVERALENRRQLEGFVQRLLKENVDFGKLPNTDKPSLRKSGAEKLLQGFGLGHSFEEVERVEDWDNGFFYYKFRCDVFKSFPDGRVAYIASALGSCNSKEKRYRTQDPFSIANTVLKMAQKRALVAAALQATATSDMFTQDLDEDEETATSASAQARAQQSSQSQDEGQEIREAVFRKLAALATDVLGVPRSKDGMELAWAYFRQTLGVDSLKQADVSALDALAEQIKADTAKAKKAFQEWQAKRSVPRQGQESLV